MTDRRLHGTKQERTIRRPIDTKHRTQRFDFDRITEWCAGAMRFHVIHIGRRDARHLERASNHLLLRRTIRNGEAAAAPVRIHGRAADDGEDVVAIGLRVGESAQCDHAAAFPAHEAVRVGIERSALAIRGEHAPLREEDRRDG